MASYRKRNGTWEYRIRYTDPATGKQKEKSVAGFKRKADCIEAAAEAEKKIKSGHFNSDDSVLFIEYAEKWLANYAINNKESTVRPRKIEQKRLIKQFGYIKIKQITSIMYQDFLDELNKIYATNTISGTHSVARMIFKKAYQDNIIDRDPTLYAILPKKLETAQDIQNKISNPVSKNIEVEKIKLILATAKEQGLENDYETFSLLASTGIRVGELIALKYDDLKSQNGKYEIVVTKTLYNPTNNMREYRLLPPKTKGSIRSIDISKELYDLITSLITKQKAIKFATGASYHNEKFIFAKTNGYPQHAKQIANRLSRILKLCKIEDKYTPHSFRHSYATLLEELQLPQVYIQKQLGHASFETTQSTYIHITDNIKKEASAKVNNLAKSFLQ